MRLEVTRGETPLGPIVVALSDAGVVALEFTESDRPGGWRFARRLLDAEFVKTDAGRPVLDKVRRYFAGELSAVDDVRVAAQGAPFERRVWDELRRIPRGTTTSYGALAAALGRPGAARAVGTANAHNPVAIVVPCHRVIGADGSLTGYAGGLELKRRLLEHEQLVHRGDAETQRKQDETARVG
jgi:O-6-methylguanine DNA methyltransferase